ncbi:MAG: hypothetical protein ACTSPI_01300 [Candidatus Heimdallarchaeaceae archaeon]
MKQGTKEHREFMKKIARLPRPSTRGENNVSKRLEVRKKISEANSNEKHARWKGNKVGYHALHAWIKRHKPKPELCEICKQKKAFDLANKSGKYKRDLNDWEWVCRRCHMKKDGRLKFFKKYVGRNKTCLD